MAEWQAAPVAFPEAFQGAAQQPSQPPRASHAAPAQASPAQQARAAPADRHAHRSDFDASSEPRPARSRVKRLAFATVAITVIGGGALALATYHQPLMDLVSGSSDGTTADGQQPPVVSAPEETKIAQPSPATGSRRPMPIRPRRRHRLRRARATLPRPLPPASDPQANDDLLGGSRRTCCRTRNAGRRRRSAAACAAATALNRRLRRRRAAAEGSRLGADQERVSGLVRVASLGRKQARGRQEIRQRRRDASGAGPRQSPAAKRRQGAGCKFREIAEGRRRVPRPPEVAPGARASAPASVSSRRARRAPPSCR